MGLEIDGGLWFMDILDGAYNIPQQKIPVFEGRLAIGLNGVLNKNEKQRGPLGTLAFLS